MTRRIFTAMTVMALAVTVIAVPVRRGVTKTITLDSGQTIELTLQGDEYLHYWADAQGNRYEQKTIQANSSERQSDNEWVRISDDNFMQMKNAAMEIRAKANEQRIQHLPTRSSSSSEQPKNITGQHRGIVILVNFANLKFKAGHNAALYNRITNEPGYSESLFKGSVRDYFLDQSEGKLDLTFDVVGPVELSKNYAYYGENPSWGGIDMRAGEMATEAILAANELVDYTPYDWDGDGEVDQVFIIYAGEGESSSGDANAIWPHQSMVRDMECDGKRFRTYACGPELYGTYVDGIGTMCHEFSHCLGYPDLYDVMNYANYGMSTWDVMADGCNNGYGYRPCGFTGYEKWMAGWIEPIELTEPCDIQDMLPQSEGGATYIIYNQAHPNEYYMIDNRQKTRWDSDLPGSGMLIMHVDYNQHDWWGNSVNNDPSHQRFTIFHADNEEGTKSSSIANDPYPFGDNNALNNLTEPATWLYNGNTDGSKMMNISIYNITQNTDGTMNFSFEPTSNEKPGAEGAIFYESFDKCAGKGGADYLWKGGSAAFTPDNDGWTSAVKHGANQCALFGSAAMAKKAVTPAFTLNGDATISFRCAPYQGDSRTLAVYLCNEAGEKTLLTDIEMQANHWKTVVMEVTGTGSCTLSFEPKKRFFLDEVRIASTDNTAINDLILNSQSSYHHNFNLAGQKVGKDFKGLVIKNGKKIIVKK